MKVRFMPRSIWGMMATNNEAGTYIEREMDVLPTIGMSVQFDGEDGFVNLLHCFTMKGLKQMMEYDGFESYCGREIIDTLLKCRSCNKMLDTINDHTDHCGWKVDHIYYLIDLNVYMALVTTEDRK